MKMSKLSNQTNSQDPQAVNSRVFVGNLNTFQCSKTDVERMFQRYGRLAVQPVNRSSRLEQGNV
uniref:RRM domain-containing protein n=1 Tax=Anopheles dirus TaxID=7168 RepID=A0A182N968_9DIPT